jgi:hypothetical protein
MDQIFRRMSSNLSSCKERSTLINILPLVDTTALSRSWPCSSLDLHFCSRQGPRTQLLDYKFLGLARDIVIYEELQQSLWRPHNHVMRFKETHKSALPKSTSMAQQRLPSSKKMKESVTMTNLTPRINRISSIALIQPTPNITSY